jgi:hypothetical protein
MRRTKARRCFLPFVSLLLSCYVNHHLCLAKQMRIPALAQAFSLSTLITMLRALR